MAPFAAAAQDFAAFTMSEYAQPACAARTERLKENI